MSNTNDFKIENGYLKKYIGNSAHVIIPNTVTAIGFLAFHGYENLQNITIPESVTKIHSGAFYGCKNLQSITIPNGITVIDLDTFRGCENLQSVTIPDTVTAIAYNAFHGCENLQSLTIPESVIKIYDGAFYGCKSLQRLTIPGSVKEIGTKIFSENMSLRACVLAPESEDEEQCKTLLNTLGTGSLALPFLLGTLETNDILSKNLQSRITNKTFRSKFIPVLIANGETEAFGRLLSLVKKMDLDEMDSYIECASSANIAEITSTLLEYKNKLYPSEKISEIQEIQSQKDFGILEKTLADYKKIFSIKKENDVYIITKYKGEDPDVLLPSYINGIPVQYLLAKDQKIQNVIIEDGIKSIGKEAFCCCENLQSILMPESVKSIGECAFLGCKGLQDKNGMVIIQNTLFDYFGQETDVTIPDGVKTIGKFAFQFCQKIKSITISKDCTSIGELAFSNCTKLQSITIPKDVTSIGALAFSHCTKLQSITIPANTKRIGKEAFWACEKLKTVYYGGTEEAWEKVSGKKNIPVQATVVYNVK